MKKLLITVCAGLFSIALATIVFGGQVTNYSSFVENTILTATQLESNFSEVITQVNANDEQIASLAQRVQDLETALANAQQELPLGVNQTWENLTSQRSGNTTYINDTGRPIVVNIAMQKSVTAGPNLQASLYVGTATPPTVPVGYAGATNSGTEGGTITAIVPNNHYYKLDLSSGDLVYWSELRTIQ
jgi:hypothetical protein